MAPNAATRGVRGLVLLVVGAFIVANPAFVQVLGVKSRWLRSWQFFSNFGATVCDVRFERQQCAGCRVPLRPRDVLGEKLDRWRVWRMQHAEHVRHVAGELCTALGRGEVRLPHLPKPQPLRTRCTHNP